MRDEYDFSKGKKIMIKCKKCDIDISAEIRKNINTAIYLFKTHIGRNPDFKELRIITDNVIKEMFEKSEGIQLDLDDEGKVKCYS